MQNLTTLRTALLESPQNVRLWLLYGQSCLSGDDLEEARKAFEKAEALSPGDPEARLGIASVLFRKGKLSEAAVRTQSILQHHTSFAPAHLLLSRIFLAENERERAHAHYSTAKMLSKSVKDRDLEREFVHQHHRHASSLPDTPCGFAGLTSDPDWDMSDELDLAMFSGLDETDEECQEDAEPAVAGEEEEQFDILEYERPKGCFQDVAGMEEIKEELRMKLIYPYEYPDLFRAYGKKAGGGILLYGPPGCGKSLVCRAIAGETDATFFSLRLHQILEMYIGCSEKNLHSLFEAAREKAPSIIFIDELDALGADRAEMKQSVNRTVVNQLLMELDGLDGENEGVLVIAATSALWNVDPAFLRPGRFDRRIFVPPPSQEERKKILEMQAANRPVTELDFESLASQLVNYSGADIAQVFDVATEDVLRLAIRMKEVIPLTTSALESAIRKVSPSIPLWDEHRQRHGNP